MYVSIGAGIDTINDLVILTCVDRIVSNEYSCLSTAAVSRLDYSNAIIRLSGRKVAIKLIIACSRLASHKTGPR